MEAPGWVGEADIEIAYEYFRDVCREHFTTAVEIMTAPEPPTLPSLKLTWENLRPKPRFLGWGSPHNIEALRRLRRELRGE